MQAASTYPELSRGRTWRSALAAAFRSVIAFQIAMTHRFDALLAPELLQDGNRDFLDRIVGEYLTPGTHIYDVGGGKNPVVSTAWKARLALRVTGLDIDRAELTAAPEGAYDAIEAADIAAFRGSSDADLVICQALLEHVPDTARAIAGIASILKPGARALIFVPSRNAAFARLNLLLPERLKRAILFGVFPKMSRDHGFPAYYDRCTPAAMARIAGRCGLTAERRYLYFQSDYFRFCFPLYAAWRIAQAVFRRLAGSEAAETFTFVFRKEG